MRLKSYYAATVEAAMRLARQELGEEAMLMNSRPSPPEAKHMGAYEVVFATGVEPSPSRAPQPEVPAPAIAAEVAEIRRQLHRMSTALARVRPQRHTGLASGRVHPWITEVFEELTSAEVDEGIATAIASALDQHAIALDPERTRDAVGQLLFGYCNVAPSLGAPAASRRIAALIGPPGSGKTTALVKLAVRYGLTTRRPTQILSIDTTRIAAADQLRTFATILGAGFEAVESVPALTRSLEEHTRKDLVLIDTPGYSPGDMEYAGELAAWISARPDIDRHLVLSCAMKSTDVSTMVERFAVFQPSKLIFTHLDETSTFGSLVNIAAQARIPVSFLSCGQRIPEDLEPASLHRIVELVLGDSGHFTPGRAAAAGSAGR
jgi:flagellar biosynthesis protein FlhF